MVKFKNVALQREYQDLVFNLQKLERGSIGGCSIEIEINEPLSYDSFIYIGKTANEDREHDFLILETLLKERATC